jgi:hypothetical protein
MPVPSWNPILDNEIDPESPITASLMQRLRDNICAVLGIDPLSPTVPTVPYPPSQLACVAEAEFYAAAGASTTSEIVVSDLAEPFEKIDLESTRSEVSNLTDPDIPYNRVGFLLDGHFTYANQNGVLNLETCWWMVTPPKIVYVSGSPDSLQMRIRRVGGNTAVAPSTSTISIPLDNTYHNYTVFDAKARATSTDVYLQLRSKGLISINFHMRRYAYRTKA